MPHEMVMSKAEKASLHPSEIFITHTTDWIDVETIQMKAPIFHTKGFVGLNYSFSTAILKYCCATFNFLACASSMYDTIL